MAKESDILSEAKQRLQDADDAWASNRSDALDDLRFARMGEQWPDEVIRDREREGRPCLTINKMPTFIRQVVNDVRQNRPSIKVHPVDSGSDPETAEVMSELIRNIEYSSNAEVAYDTAAEYAVSCGFGFFRIDVDYAFDDSFDMDILIKRISNPFAVHFDPNTQEADSSDWGYAFISDFLTEEAFLRQYKGADLSNWEASDTKEGLWRDANNVRVAEYWTREEAKGQILLLNDGTILQEDQYLKNKQLFDSSGLTVAGNRETKTHKVMQRILSGAQVLEENQWAGRYIPIVPVYGDEVDVEGQRYFRSLIRDAKDAQRMFNYWRTASTELVALAPKAPFIGPKGAFVTDYEKWETANVKTHPYIEYDGGTPPQRQPFSGVPAGALQEAMNASDDMKAIMGLYDASLGARSNETSGKAIMARQREGDVATFHFIDNLTRGIRHAGRILIDLIPKIYDKPRIVRLMGEDGTPKSTQINQPNQDGKLFDLTAGKYDLTVNAGPSFTSRREEAAGQMIELLRAFPSAAPIIGDIVAKNLDWPGADDIAKRLKAMLPPNIQQMEDEGEEIPPQVQAMIMQGKQQIQAMQQQLQQGLQAFQQLQAELVEAKKAVQDKQADIMVKREDSQLKHEAEMAKAQAEIQIAQIEAESAKQVASIEASVAALQAKLEGMTQMMQAQPQQAPIYVGGGRKKVTVQAPSGNTYVGTIEEEDE
jgi:hypothetical protein